MKHVHVMRTIRQIIGVFNLKLKTMARAIINYIQEELSSISERLKEFTEWGYSDELAPLVDTMCEYKNKLQLLEVEELERELGNKKNLPIK